jgi:hypothetical protein
MKCDLYVRSTDEGKEEMRNMMYGMMTDNDLQEE